MFVVHIGPCLKKLVDHFCVPVTGRTELRLLMKCFQNVYQTVRALKYVLYVN